MAQKTRIEQLDRDHNWCSYKITECIAWLVNKPNEHPDRSLIFSNKSYYEYQRQLIKKKIINLTAGYPENGTLLDLEDNNLNSSVINKTTS